MAQTARSISGQVSLILGVFAAGPRLSRVQGVDWLARVERVCARTLTAKALREALLEALKERLPFDGHYFGLTDPVTMVGTSPHAIVPMLPWPRVPEIVRWRYQTLINRVDTLAGRPAVSLLVATRGAPETAPIWRYVLSEVGVADAATVAFADRYGTWGFLEVWRSTPFTPAEVDVLTSIQGPVTAGLRAALARTFAEPGDRPLDLGAAVLVLGPDLTVRDQTESAARTLMQLLPPDEPMPPVPAAAFNAGAALLADEAGMRLGEPWARIHLGSSSWVTARASRLGTDIAVSLEPSTAAERTDLFARASGLSSRETEILDLLAVGLDTREIAGALFLSEHTVNDHVKSMLAKTGVRTRSHLLARARGSS